ncbi:MAG TPA: hypothetical protein DCM40_43970, partial [Maribacter sp.]|nr:hypothetical protein [Maribacter sp.]
MSKDNTIVEPTQAHFIIEGEPASKANSRRSVLIGGKPRFIKSKKALNYEKMFKDQIQFCKLNCFEGDVGVEIKIFYASRRPDLDESLILDLMQGFAYENDRQVKEK